MSNRCLVFALALMLGLLAWPASAVDDIEILSVATDEAGIERYSLKLKVLAFMTVLTVLPALIMSTTAFLRIIIVLALLRQALGTQSTPSNQVLLGVGLFLTLFVMTPVIEKIDQDAVTPYLNDEITLDEGIERARAPYRLFMLSHTREEDLRLFADFAGIDTVDSPDDLPLTVLVPSFMLSELKAGFVIGFSLFLPFLLIDLVIASSLMGMGMMMMSPMIVSMPFKILLFISADGWNLVVENLVASFYTG